MPNVLEWIQCRFAGRRGKTCLTLADIYYAGSRLSEHERTQDRRWDAIIPRILIFKRFFKMARPRRTAVQMVEAMRDCGFTNQVLETLPEAVLTPLQDAISLCQPRPPAGWSRDLLELVRRSDISLIYWPRKQPRLTMSSILVSTIRVGILPSRCLAN